MNEFVLSKKRIILGAIVGMIGGYFYYRFVGCSSGSCAITSNPINSVLYFGFLGGLMGDMLKKRQTVKHTNHE